MCRFREQTGQLTRGENTDERQYNPNAFSIDLYQEAALGLSLSFTMEFRVSEAAATVV
jgi:hypothetical protein